MRRGWATLLLAVFSLWLFVPAISADGDAALPACCRRNGAHHCAMLKGSAGAGGPAWSQGARCASYPALRAYPAGRIATLAPSLSGAFDSLTVHPIQRAVTSAPRRAPLSRSAQKRGPPSLT
jgi:hypothetical protein